MTFAPSAPPQAQQFSSWHNPTDKVVSVDIFVGPEAGASRRYRYTWQPDETVQVPSVYDKAIHDVRGGIIMGGQAPQLRKLGEVNKIHSSLDADAAQQKAAMKLAQEAFAAKAALEQAAIMAASTMHPQVVQPAEPKGKK